MFDYKVLRGLKTQEDRVLREQLYITYRNFVIIALSSIGSSALLALILWNQLPGQSIVTWLLINTIGLVVYPIIVALRFLRGKMADLSHAVFQLKLIVLVGSLSFGLSGIFMFVPDSIEYQLYLLLTIGIGTALVTAMSMFYSPAFFISIFPLLIPVAIRFYMEGSFLATMIACIALPLLSVVLIAFFYSMHGYLIDSIRLRFEKTDLADKLQQQKQVAEQAYMDKSRFLAAASHDLRQPLHAHGLYVANLKHRITDKDSLKLLTRLEKSINSMQNLFTAMLDLSKLDANTIRPEITSVSINHIFDLLKLDFGESAHSKGLQLDFVNTNLSVQSDKTLLTRILRNLLVNAIQHTQRGKILVGCRRRNGWISIEVWDTGPGIPSNDLNSIFQEYYQVKHAELIQDKGVGLGLSISSRLATLLNHKLDVRSHIGKGSVFSIKAKISINQGKKDDIVQSIYSGEYNIPVASKNRSILIIDDNADILDSMESLLEKWEWNVYKAFSSKEALTRLGKDKLIDLIIADYSLSAHETGIKAIEAICNYYTKQIPAIIITGDTSKDRLQELIDSGYEILHKPVAPARLRALINYYFVNLDSDFAEAASN